ncbi:MAG TPA: hypothetical protein PKL29_05330 [Methanothrix sp.]|nr:hypothetical protein [Methanothrix sp.]
MTKIETIAGIGDGTVHKKIQNEWDLRDEDENYITRILHQQYFVPVSREALSL